VEIGIILESSDQKTRIFLLLVVLCDGFSVMPARCLMRYG
jgi:hypothetical protein